MAGGNLSPRQRMINMMYLVLTALLALNVSKEVLDSFFEVNKGIERTTTNFNAKNNDTYAAFDAAAELNKVKAGPFKAQAYEVKAEADAIVEFLQHMKYDLVLAADKKVYLGDINDFTDEDGNLIKEKATDSIWESLNKDQRKLAIGELNAKDNRESSGNLFYNEKKEENRATDLKDNLISFKELLNSIAKKYNKYALVNSINATFNLDDRRLKNSNKTQLWEKYNFYDMPAVGALTLLSKMQADIRNSESGVIDMLRENIDAESLKFTSATGIAVPKSNFVLRGDKFEADVFIAAKDTTQDPKIYIGAYEDLGNGKYKMQGEEGKDYNALEVVDGKGKYSVSASSEGVKKWGGLIVLKTKDEEKTYPFEGEYLVASKQAVASPTNMNVLYVAVDNPIKVAVAGYSASQVTASLLVPGEIKSVSKNKGEWIVKPSKMNSKSTPVIRLYVTENGKKKSMGEIKFRIKDVPDPKPQASGVKSTNVSKAKLKGAQFLQAVMGDDFLFSKRAVSYSVKSFDVVYSNTNGQFTKSIRGKSFTSEVMSAIDNTKPGQTISFMNIKAKRPGVAKIKDIGSLIYKIK